MNNPTIWYREINSYDFGKVSIWKRIKWKLRRRKYKKFIEMYEKLGTVDFSELAVERLENGEIKKEN